MVAAKQRQAVEKLLKRKPVDASNLIKITEHGDYLPTLRLLSKTNPVLAARIWDNGWRFIYWIRPMRIGKNWKRIYAGLKISTEYDRTVNDF